MNLLAKIELLVNRYLTRLIDILMGRAARVIPAPVKALFHRTQSQCRGLLVWLRHLPASVLGKVLTGVSRAKSLLGGIDVKARLRAAYEEALGRFNFKESGKLTFLKGAIATPFVIVGKWLQGLSVTQSLVLLTFTASSFLAGLSIVSTGQRLVKGAAQADRAPASSEALDEYERPNYYKENRRHFSITNLRLPVYVGEVNELRSVDIDFTATVSTRRARKYLEQQEFQLRDHLLSSMEPIVASFPLSDEGKEVVKHKIHQELDIFLQEREVSAKVVKLRLTYILAN